MGHNLLTTTYVMTVPAVCLAMGHLITRRRTRDALVIPPDTPVTRMDARDPPSSQHTLITLVEHAMVRTPAG